MKAQRKVIALFASALALAALSALADGAWTPLGPFGGQVSSLAVDPSAPQTVYAATQGGGVFKSTDGAATWQPAGSGLPSPFVGLLAIDPATPQTLYAGGDFGLAKSDDGAATWHSLLLPSFTAVSGLAIDPSAPRTLYAGVAAGVAKSTDGGATWEPAVSSRALASPISALVVDPRRPSFVYAATSLVGVARSTDGGRTWTHAGPLVGRVRALALAPQQTATVYAGFAPNSGDDPNGTVGLFVSKNGGRSWVRSRGGLGALGVTALAVVPGRLYAGTDGGGVLASTDGGASWSPGHGSEGASVGALAVDPSGPATVYAGSGTFQRQDAGVRKSADGGADWSVANDGLTALSITALAVAPGPPQRLLVGTRSLGVFSRLGTADRLTPAGNGLPSPGVASLAWSGASSDSFYGVVNGLGAGRRARLVKTSDGGDSWTTLPFAASAPYAPLHAPYGPFAGLSCAPDLPGTCYVADADAILTVEGDGARTTVHPLPGRRPVAAIVVAPSSPNVLYAGTDANIHAGPGQPWKSVDHGATWTPLQLDDDFYVALLAVDPQDAQVVFAAGTHLHRSTDGGATWSTAGLDPTARVVGLATAPGAVYVGLAPTGGDPAAPATIWKSTDAGATWTALAARPPSVLTTLAVDPAGGTLYAGTAAGVYAWTAP